MSIQLREISLSELLRKVIAVEKALVVLGCCWASGESWKRLESSSLAGAAMLVASGIFQTVFGPDNLAASRAGSGSGGDRERLWPGATPIDVADLCRAAQRAVGLLRGGRARGRRLREILG